MPFTDEQIKLLETNQYELFGFSKEHIKALLVRLHAAENCFDSLMHENDCILSFREAGEPTPDGGYRTKYAGKWYRTNPVDETPKCNCGLDDKFDAWLAASGKEPK